jgi:hypothetical protein
VLTDTGCEVGAAWNKSAEDLICTLAIRDPRQRAAINDFISELALRAAEVRLEVAILRESPPKKRPTMRPTFRPTWPVAGLASHLICLQNSRVRRFPGAPTTLFGRAIHALTGGSAPAPLGYVDKAVAAHGRPSSGTGAGAIL